MDVYAVIQIYDDYEEQEPLELWFSEEAAARSIRGRRSDLYSYRSPLDGCLRWSAGEDPDEAYDRGDIFVIRKLRVKGGPLDALAGQAE